MDIISFIFGFIFAFVLIGCITIVVFIKIIIGYNKKLQEKQDQQPQKTQPMKFRI